MKEIILHGRSWEQHKIAVLDNKVGIFLPQYPDFVRAEIDEKGNTIFVDPSGGPCIGIGHKISEDLEVADIIHDAHINKFVFKLK